MITSVVAPPWAMWASPIANYIMLCVISLNSCAHTLDGMHLNTAIFSGLCNLAGCQYTGYGARCCSSAANMLRQGQLLPHRLHTMLQRHHMRRLGLVCAKLRRVRHTYAWSRCDAMHACIVRACIAYACAHDIHSGYACHIVALTKPGLQVRMQAYKELLHLRARFRFAADLRAACDAASHSCNQLTFASKCSLRGGG